MGLELIHLHAPFRRYMSGSKNMSYDSSNLTTPDIKWLGVRPSDLDRYLPSLTYSVVLETSVNLTDLAALCSMESK